MKKLYLIAGEASGDMIGAHLIRAIRKQTTDELKIFGVGGEKMEAEGLASLFPHSELSLMGFAEILPHMLQLIARINSTVEDILAKQPDVIVTIDSPGFNFRVVEKLRKKGCKARFIHYVAPTVWAYKPERAEKCAKLFDEMLVLLPFEPPYFEKEGLKCTFVGHPFICETPLGDGKDFRNKYEIADEIPLVCLLPGSRKNEINRLMPIMAATVTLLSQVYPNIALGVAVPQIMMHIVAPYFEGCPFRAVVTAQEEDKRNMIAASNVALVKSGTVALEVARAGTPMVVTYRVNPISAWLVRRMIKTPFVNLINVIEGKEVIPELLQERCLPILLANAAASLLQKNHRSHEIRQKTEHALNMLIPKNRKLPSDIAADTVISSVL